ncbi:MAG TPA: ABC-F family ATP-binding cassette domain-containing protein [Thermoanaerobaculia bacterium]|jgi:ATPase subunit of ABC transporter with duplicated ATPase domains|nr:ABC-F family ATP-binding cassette domain-containing protein [Thermoanaerobaculia bacterium]
MISFANVSKQYGKQVLFVEASFQLNPGEKAGLVGPNGAGKSTLFRMITGEEGADDGVVNVPKKIAIGYFKQEVDEMSGRPVLDEAIAGSGRLGDLHHELIELEQNLHDEQALARYGEVQEEYQHLGGYELEARAREVLHGLGFDDAQIDGDVGALSGGWKMRVSMAKILLGKFDVLLLDEPTNHLDIESIVWLERYLRSVPSTILMTSHDRDFMNRLVTKVVEIDDGDILTYSGDYDFYVREREIREANQEAAYGRQQAKLAKEQRFIDRFSAHAAKAAQVQSRVKMLEKQERIEPPKKRKAMKFDFRSPQRSGEDVVALKGVHKTFGKRTIYDGFDFQVRRGERWCVMGKNGAGKSTLLKMVAGALTPDSGSVRLGASLKVGYFAQQSLDLLDADLTVMEQIQKDFPLEGIGTLRSLLGAFQFSGDDVDKRIRSLSGGEKSRLVMARMLLDPPNFLVLDEPTNHLDLATKEMLVDALKDFEGTMLFVSHDRTFLRGLANRVLELAPEDHPQPLTYGGSYVEYVEKTGREAPGVHA